jgi:hypothetical protein
MMEIRGDLRDGRAIDENLFEMISTRSPEVF